MIGNIPKSWTPTRHESVPTVDVCVAEGWEYESVAFDAADCRELADALLNAAERLDALEQRWRDTNPDRATNVDLTKHAAPRVPIDWKLEVGLPLSAGELFTHSIRSQLQSSLILTSWSEGTGKPEKRTKARRT